MSTNELGVLTRSCVVAAAALIAGWSALIVELANALARTDKPAAAATVGCLIGYGALTAIGWRRLFRPLITAMKSRRRKTHSSRRQRGSVAR